MMSFREFVLSKELSREGYERSLLSGGDMDKLAEVGNQFDECCSKILEESNKLNSLKKQLFYVPGDQGPFPFDNGMRACHGVALVFSEVGELLRAVEKGPNNSDVVNVAEEIGDMLFGLTVLADSFGLTLEQCEAVVKAKLDYRSLVAGIADNGGRNRDEERRLMEEALGK